MLGGAVGGLKRGDVPRVVDNLLDQCREREVQLMVRPERVGDQYMVAWQHLVFDEDAQAWEPLAAVPEAGLYG